jgi:hypothetical protein
VAQKNLEVLGLKVWMLIFDLCAMASDWLEGRVLVLAAGFDVYSSGSDDCNL